jgi:hypothetical protein
MRSGDLQAWFGRYRYGISPPVREAKGTGLSQVQPNRRLTSQSKAPEPQAKPQADANLQAPQSMLAAARRPVLWAFLGGLLFAILAMAATKVRRTKPV